MHVIGLTGGIASGKSTVTSFFKQREVPVIDADILGHRTYDPGTDTFRAVVAAFGDDLVAPDGTIDRKVLGAQGLRQARGTEAPHRHRLAGHPQAGERATLGVRSGGQQPRRPRSRRPVRSRLGRPRRRDLGGRGRTRPRRRAAGCPQRPRRSRRGPRAHRIAALQRRAYRPRRRHHREQRHPRRARRRASRQPGTNSRHACKAAAGRGATA